MNMNLPDDRGSEAYYAFEAHKSAVLAAKTPEAMRRAIEGLENRMGNFCYCNTEDGKYLLLYAAIIAAMNEGESFKDELSDYLAFWEGKL